MSKCCLHGPPLTGESGSSLDLLGSASAQLPGKLVGRVLGRGELVYFRSSVDFHRGHHHTETRVPATQAPSGCRVSPMGAHQPRESTVRQGDLAALSVSCCRVTPREMGTRPAAPPGLPGRTRLGGCRVEPRGSYPATNLSENSLWAPEHLRAGRWLRRGRWVCERGWPGGGPRGSGLRGELGCWRALGLWAARRATGRQ